jgi:hypothetical protein
MRTVHTERVLIGWSDRGSSAAKLTLVTDGNGQHEPTGPSVEVASAAICSAA